MFLVRILLESRREEEVIDHRFSYLKYSTSNLNPHLIRLIQEKIVNILRERETLNKKMFLLLFLY